MTSLQGITRCVHVHGLKPHANIYSNADESRVLIKAHRGDSRFLAGDVLIWCGAFAEGEVGPSLVLVVAGPMGFRSTW